MLLKLISLVVVFVIDGGEKAPPLVPLASPLQFTGHLQTDLVVDLHVHFSILEIKLSKTKLLN